MPSRASKKREDFAETAFRVVALATGQVENLPPGDTPAPPTRSEASAAAAALSRLGASKGGHARAQSLSAAKRKAIARKAAAARWLQRERLR